MFYIIRDRAFTQKTEAINYCDTNDISVDCIIYAKPTQKEKYFELQTTSNEQIFHNRFYTTTELERPENKEYIQNLRNGEYYSRLVHLKEISEREYLKYTS